MALNQMFSEEYQKGDKYWEMSQKFTSDNIYSLSSWVHSQFNMLVVHGSGTEGARALVLDE